MAYKHFELIEKHAGLLAVGIAIMVSLGGLAEITPLFVEAHSLEAPPGVHPYDPLRLAGKDVYVREGCYLCHSQMIRALRFETERYGHFSTAAESVYDRPFQWGSKRTGPDLARVGGKYSDDWQRAHLMDPRQVVPQSNMPAYPWLAEKKARRGRHPGAHAHSAPAGRSVQRRRHRRRAGRGGRQDRDGRDDRLPAGPRHQERARPGGAPGQHRRCAMTPMSPVWGHVAGVVIVVMMLTFIGIWIWAWRKYHKPTFNRMARLPMEDERDIDNEEKHP